MPKSVAEAPGPAFHALRVARLIRETADACSVVLGVPAELEAVFRYKAGQFVTLQVSYEGSLLTRCYSFSSSPDTDAEPRITVKRVHEGRISNWVNSQLEVGDMLWVRPPEGRFVLGRRAERLLLFAAGSGITPVISLAKSALATSESRLTIVYANRNADSAIFVGELSKLVRAHPGRLRVVKRFDNVDGFIRAADVTRIVDGAADLEVFVCGPQGYMDAVLRGLEVAAVPRGHVHVERFVSPAHQVSEGSPSALPSSTAVPDTVRVERMGKQFDIPYVRGKTLLETALAAGIAAPYSCEEGVCGACAARLVDGHVRMAEDAALTADEKNQGYVLTCQAHPTSASCSIKYPDF